MLYAVIDTNVLVSALICRNTLSATVKVIYNMLQGNITPVYNDEILSEYSEVLHRSKFRFNKMRINIIIDYIKEYGIHCDRTPYTGHMPDEKDRPFYEVSLSMKSSFLITGNSKHFPVTPKVMTPAGFIALMEAERKA